ncbi:MAG: DinB family protein [Acidobacteriota bacterium]
MSEIEKIVEDMQRIYDGDARYGLSLREALQDVTLTQAVAKPISSAHSIWEIVLHIAAWQNVFADRLMGRAMEEPAEGDFPPIVDPGELAWVETLVMLNRAQEGFLKVVSQLPDSRLNETVIGRDYSVRFMLDNAIRHCIYHTGQIALLRKA